MEKRPSDKKIREIVFPVDPENPAKTMKVGFCHGERLAGRGMWRLLGLDENGQWEDRGRCSHEHVRKIEGLTRHVRYKQSGVVCEGYGVIESWEFRDPPPTWSSLVIGIVQRIHGWPALG